MGVKKLRLFVVLSCVLILATSILAGCGTAAKQSEFYEHDSVYKNWDHMSFSWDPNPVSEEAVVKTEKQDWWGIPQKK